MGERPTTVRQVIPRDAIPSVDDPRFVADYDGLGADEVLAIDRAGEARAYPVRYLHYHEIVNDVLGDRTIAVTWCPLCGSGVVYDRVVDGRPLTFGVSGKLADDDLVLYDRETESEWKQSLGVAIDGPYEGTTLDVLPATMTTWAAFREAHPQGVALAPPGGQSEAGSDTADPAPVDYDVAPYEAYFAGEGFGLGAHRGTGGRSWDRDDIDPKTVVLGLRMDGEALGVPLPALERAGGVVRVTVGDTDAVVVAADDGLHAFEDPGFPLRVESGRLFGDGARWHPAGGTSDDGRRLVRLPSQRLFAFAWQDDHGPDAFLGT